MLNKKQGAIPVTVSNRKTCPPSCPRTRIEQAKFLLEQMILVFEVDVNSRHSVSEYLDLNSFPSLSNHERESISSYAWAFVTSYTRQYKYTEEKGLIPLDEEECTPSKRQLDSLEGDAMLLSMAACQNAWLGLRENNIDPDHPDNTDLVLMHWVEGIRSSLSFEEHSAELIKTFANIGITA
jgi:hypothetical protein